MTKVNVTVKWRNQVFNDVELHVSEPLILFKTQLWQLTNVPPDKQKLMYKGLLKDDVDLSNLNIKQNDRIMLIGSAESLPEKTQNTIFVEDLTPAEKELLFQKKNITIEEQGIVNLGNSCYFNAILQFLNSFDDLMNFLKNFKKKDSAIPYRNKSVKEQFFDAYVNFAKVFGKSTEPAEPRTLLEAFRKCYPQFSERSPITKEFLHQDAEECLNAIFSVLNEESGCNIVDKLFSFRIVSKIKQIKEESETPEKKSIEKTEKETKEEKEKEKEKTVENEKEKTVENEKEKTVENETEKKEPENVKKLEKEEKKTEEENIEEVETTEEFHTKLRCYMGNQLEPTKHMYEGIHLFFKEKIEKFCEKKGKNVLFERLSEIDSLPPYLIVHFARFEWVQTTEGLQVKSGRAKICRKVNFSQNFDIFDFCSEKLKKELNIARGILTKRKGEELLKGRDKKEENAEIKTSPIEAAENKKIEEENKEGGEQKEEQKQEQKQEEEKKEQNKEDNDKKSDMIELFTGHYELLSVVTHTGRYATRGHYIAWKKVKENASDNSDNTADDGVGLKKKRKINDPTWLQFDDDKVSTHKFSSVDLTGGRSDYHIAFLLLFKRQTILCTQEEIDKITNFNKQVESEK